MEKIFYLLYGPPASGKSTYSRTLEAHCCEIDDYPGLYNENGNINFEKLPLAHIWSKEAFLKAAQNNSTLAHTVINISSPNTQYYLDVAKQYNYQVKIIKPRCGLLFYPNDLTEEQQIESMIKSRDKDSGKYVPPEVIRNCCAMIK